MTKINKKTGKSIDPMFDGHLEKTLSKMTPKEKIHYLWLQMVFRWRIKNRREVSGYDSGAHRERAALD